MITEERRKEMLWYWENEITEEDEEWRDELTEEELELVDRWDAGYSGALAKLCEKQEE